MKFFLFFIILNCNGELIRKRIFFNSNIYYDLYAKYPPVVPLLVLIGDNSTGNKKDLLINSFLDIKMNIVILKDEFGDKNDEFRDFIFYIKKNYRPRKLITLSSKKNFDQLVVPVNSYSNKIDFFLVLDSLGENLGHFNKKVLILKNCFEDTCIKENVLKVKRSIKINKWHTGKDSNL